MTNIRIGVPSGGMGMGVTPPWRMYPVTFANGLFGFMSGYMAIDVDGVASFYPQKVLMKGVYRYLVSAKAEMAVPA